MEPWHQTISLLLLPPGIFFLFILLGLMVNILWRFTGALIIAISTTILISLSIPLSGHLLASSLESIYPPLTLVESDKHSPEAIIILSSNRYANAPEYEADTVSSFSLVRLRYGVALHKKTGLPILLSGGSPYGEQISEAKLMEQTLISDYGIHPKWIESESKNTIESAFKTKAMLIQNRVRSVYLVTHAWHMPRAVWAYTQAGHLVTPAPTGFSTLNNAERTTIGYLPSAHGLYLSSLALRERLGLIWYKNKFEPSILASMIKDMLPKEEPIAEPEPDVEKDTQEQIEKPAINKPVSKLPVGPRKPPERVKQVAPESKKGIPEKPKSIGENPRTSTTPKPKAIAPVQPISASKPATLTNKSNSTNTLPEREDTNTAAEKTGAKPSSTDITEKPNDGDQPVTEGL